MESSDFNLMPLEVQEARQKDKHQKTLNKGALFLFVVATIATVGVVFYEAYLQRKIAQTEQAIEQERKTLRSFQDLEVLVRNAAQRYNTLEVIYGQYPHYSLLLEKLALKVPSGVKVTDLAVISPEQVSLSGEAEGYLVIAKFVKALSLKEEGTIFAGVTVPRVSFDGQAGLARFSLNISLVQGALL